MTASSERLVWRHDFGGASRDAFDFLMRCVFGSGVPRAVAPRWVPIGCFEPDGRCIAGALFAHLDLACDEADPAPRVLTCPVGALRMIAVAEDHRGRGLFRTLMEHVLTRAAALDAILLYTGEPALYGRFGFAPLAQFAFAGEAPAAEAAPPARRLDPERDGALIRRLLAARTPVSRQVAMVGSDDLFLEKIGSDPDLCLAHMAEIDALVVYEPVGDTLRLVDVVAAAMPRLAEIVGGLSPRFGRVETLFPPDRLAWTGEPIIEDTGLMARGRLPLAMRRPFMLPPTTEF